MSPSRSCLMHSRAVQACPVALNSSRDGARLIHGVGGVVAEL